VKEHNVCKMSRPAAEALAGEDAERD
jgi:hypothetical protein